MKFDARNQAFYAVISFSIDASSLSPCLANNLTVACVFPSGSSLRAPSVISPNSFRRTRLDPGGKNCGTKGIEFA
jgi:hypothetical protein